MFSFVLAVAATGRCQQDATLPLSDRRSTTSYARPSSAASSVSLHKPSLGIGLRYRFRQGLQRQSHYAGVLLRFGPVAPRSPSFHTKSKGLGFSEKPLLSTETLAASRLPTATENPRSESIVVIKSGDLVAAIKASRLAEKWNAKKTRLDEMVRRAKISAALPRLGIRVTHLLDQSASSSPTSYDPWRTTSRDGTSMWLEARANWSLGRLLFASEELQVERWRQKNQRQRRRQQRRLIRQLQAWQKSMLALHYLVESPADCWKHWLREQQLAASLQRLTRGWFELWRRGRGWQVKNNCLQDQRGQ